MPGVVNTGYDISFCVSRYGISFNAGDDIQSKKKKKKKKESSIQMKACRIYAELLPKYFEVLKLYWSQTCNCKFTVLCDLFFTYSFDGEVLKNIFW